MSNPSPNTEAALALFGFVPADTVATAEQATLAYGDRKVVITPAGENLASAAQANRVELDLDTTDLVNVTKDGEVVAMGETVEPGAFYTFATKQGGKGAVLNIERAKSPQEQGITVAQALPGDILVPAPGQNYPDAVVLRLSDNKAVRLDLSWPSCARVDSFHMRYVKVSSATLLVAN